MNRAMPISSVIPLISLKNRIVFPLCMQRHSIHVGGKEDKLLILKGIFFGIRHASFSVIIHHPDGVIRSASRVGLRAGPTRTDPDAAKKGILSMWFFCLPSLVAILVIGFIQVRDELHRHPETEATKPEETAAVLVPIEIEI